MPEGAITLECGPLILSIASQHSIEVIDASPLSKNEIIHCHSSLCSEEEGDISF